MKVASQELTSSFECMSGLGVSNKNTDLVLVHGNPYSLEQPALLENLCKKYPNACIAGCSSSGEMLNGEAFENSIVYSAIEFDYSTARQTRVNLVEGQEDEFEAGKVLARELLGDDLAAVIVYSEGLSVDCDELIKGIFNIIDPSVPLIGGLAADNNAAQYTVVMDREGVYSDAVVAVGIYGKRIEVNSVASAFDQDGIEIDITSSEGNAIHQINQKPALGVYENLISQLSDQQLSSRLFHPLVILDKETKQALFCRTIAGYEIDDGSVFTAGSAPEGPAKLISLTGFDDIIDDTNKTCISLKGQTFEFSLVINCAGRKDAMGSEWMKESPFIQNILGDTSSLGFYSFGEIGKSNSDNTSVVHNHTLTVATFLER